MKKLEKLIPLAMAAAESKLATDGKIRKEYKGYIASFGAKARAGLRPAVAEFENKSADSARDRTKLMQALLEIVLQYRRAAGTPPARLMEYVLSAQNPRQAKQDIMDAATALKLAIRTFDLG